MVTWADGADCTPPAPADARSSFARATGLSRPTAMILRTSADIWSRQFLAERADLPQGAVAIGLAFDEAVHQSALEILGARTRRKIDAGIADGIVNAVDIERIAHDAMAYAITAAGPGGVAEQHDLRLGELDTRGARRDGGVEIEISADLLGARQLDLAERERDAERGRAVGDAQGVVNLAGDFVAARVRLADGFDGE